MSASVAETQDSQQLAAPAPAHCPGTQSEQAGKADACAGCPNQQICATAPKGPDPGTNLSTPNIAQAHCTWPIQSNSERFLASICRSSSDQGEIIFDQA